MPDALPTLANDRYAIAKKLGEGGQATSFEAVDKREGRLVVIKRFRVRGAGSWKEVELAEREAAVLAAIRHPSLPRYVEHFEEGGELFLVTDKIEGESLRELRARRASLSARDIERFFADARAALDYLHGRSPPVVHRDIKPGNVIRRPDGSFAFIDFGSVRDRLKPEGGSTVVGTFGYMAPEQFQGRAMPASDVYAVGVTALVMLTGRDPEDLPHKGLALDVGAALRGLRVDAAIVRALEAMLQTDPDKRASRVPALSKVGGDSKKEDRRERKRDRKDARRDAERTRREARADARRAREAARWDRFQRGEGVRLPPIAAVPMLFGLAVAAMAVWFSLRVAVPVVLVFLSILFGRGLRVAARSVRDAGARAGDAIARARRAVASNASSSAPAPAAREQRGGARIAVSEVTGEEGPAAWSKAGRVRVAATRDDDGEPDAEAEREAELQQQTGRRPSRQHRK